MSAREGRVKDFLADPRVQGLLSDNNLFEVYTLFDEEISAPRGRYPSELTEFFIDHNITVFDYMDTIIEGMFAGTDVKEVTVPGKIKVLSPDTFYICRLLKEVILEEGVEEIKKEAFVGCPSLEKLILPKSIKHIEDQAFLSCGEFTVYCYENTYAHEWAENIYGAHVILLD